MSPFDGYGHRGIGVSEMVYTIRTGRPNRCSKKYDLHCLKVLAAKVESAVTSKTVEPASRFEMKPLAPGTILHIGFHGPTDAEKSLVD